jgi:pilus assembly protein Flp/PilA
MTSFGLLRRVTARRLVGFLADRRGATAVEYGLMVALISLAIIATVFSMGQGIKTTLYDAISNALAAM